MTEGLAIALLRKTASRLPSDFSGIGLMFYRHLDRLPFLDLAVDLARPDSIPINGLDAIAELLVSVSKSTSLWHDGFHFVDLDRQRLTHLAQFVSPPIPSTAEDIPREAGARHMTAALATLVEGIVCAGIITNKRELLMFEHGRCAFREQAS